VGRVVERVEQQGEDREAHRLHVHREIGERKPRVEPELHAKRRRLRANDAHDVRQRGDRVHSVTRNAVDLARRKHWPLDQCVMWSVEQGRRPMLAPRRDEQRESAGLVVRWFTAG